MKKDEGRVVVEAGSIGYEILLPLFVLRSLLDNNKKEGDTVSLEIYYHVSEKKPKPLLVGFNNEYEKKFFERLIEVEGIGPGTAARAMVFSVSSIASAIEADDINFLVQMPGIGERTAHKVVATLRGKVAEWALLKDEGYVSLPTVEENVREEAIELLAGLGYKKLEARQKVEAIIKINPRLKNVEELIREVFRIEKKR